VEGAGQSNLKQTFSLVSSYNGNRTARRVIGEFRFPYATEDAVTGLATVHSVVPISINAALPLNVPDSVVQEAVAQATNLFVSTLIRSAFVAGYAPT
jgi:hypothetical protein